jgi:hypothetical protein
MAEFNGVGAAADLGAAAIFGELAEGRICGRVYPPLGMNMEILAGIL